MLELRECGVTEWGTIVQAVSSVVVLFFAYATIQHSRRESYNTMLKELFRISALDKQPDPAVAVVELTEAVLHGWWRRKDRATIYSAFGISPEVVERVRVSARQAN